MCTNNCFYLNIKFCCDIVCVLLHCHMTSVKNKVLECSSGMCNFEKSLQNSYPVYPLTSTTHIKIALVVILAFIGYLLIKLLCQHMVFPLLHFVNILNKHTHTFF